VLLYDLTSTYFESPPPDDETDKRRHGYSRDKRTDATACYGLGRHKRIAAGSF
jgi:hypothetical protein